MSDDHLLTVVILHHPALQLVQEKVLLVESLPFGFVPGSLCGQLGLELSHSVSFVVLDLQRFVAFQGLVGFDFAQFLLKVYLFLLNFSQFRLKLRHLVLKLFIELTHGGEHLIVFGALDRRNVFFQHGDGFSQRFDLQFVLTAPQFHFLDDSLRIVPFDFFQKLANDDVLAVEFDGEQQKAGHQLFGFVGVERDCALGRDRPEHLSVS